MPFDPENSASKIPPRRTDFMVSDGWLGQGAHSVITERITVK